MEADAFCWEGGTRPHRRGCRQPLNAGAGGLLRPPLPSQPRPGGGGGGGGAFYCECVHSEAPGPFISFFIEVDVATEHRSKDPEAKEEDVVGGRRRCTGAISLPVNLYNVFLPFCLSENCYIYIFNVSSRICFHRPLLSSAMLPFLVFVHYFVVCLFVFKS